jgi:hypothetical protein
MLMLKLRYVEETVGMLEQPAYKRAVFSLFTSYG